MSLGTAMSYCRDRLCESSTMPISGYMRERKNCLGLDLTFNAAPLKEKPDFYFFRPHDEGSSQEKRVGLSNLDLSIHPQVSSPTTHALRIPQPVRPLPRKRRVAIVDFSKEHLKEVLAPNFAALSRLEEKLTTSIEKFRELIFDALSKNLQYEHECKQYYFLDIAAFNKQLNKHLAIYEKSIVPTFGAEFNMDFLKKNIETLSTLGKDLKTQVTTYRLEKGERGGQDAIFAMKPKCEHLGEERELADCSSQPAYSGKRPSLGFKDSASNSNRPPLKAKFSGSPESLSAVRLLEEIFHISEGIRFHLERIRVLIHYFLSSSSVATVVNPELGRAIRV